MPIKQLLPIKLRIWLYWRRANLFAAIKNIGHRLGLGKSIWKAGLPSEIAFWENYLATGGKCCAAEDEFKFRTDPDSELQPWLRKWLNCPPGGEVRVLDVGAGPLTWVGKKWSDHNVIVNAIDPLAPEYAEIMRRHGIQPPITTQAGNGEDITQLFGPNFFDLTFARNSLDHSYDAIKAVAEMIEATKPNGIIFLWHNQDEAERLSYQGLHQWNFRLESGQLIIWRGERRLKVDQAFASQLRSVHCEIHDGMIQAAYRKLPPALG